MSINFPSSGFDQITHDVNDPLAQSYRSPGLVPGPVKPGQVAGTGGADSTTLAYPVVDEFITAIPFTVTIGDLPYGRQYMMAVTTNDSGSEAAKYPLPEPAFSTTGSGTTWAGGLTTAFGVPITFGAAVPSAASPARFKKVSLFIRADELMVGNMNSNDVLKAEVQLASISIVRSLSLAILQSAPNTAGTPNDDATEFTGLSSYLQTSGQQVTFTLVSTGGAVPLGMIGGLSAIEARCHPSNGDFGAGPDVFVMSSRARWRLLKELEDKGVEPVYKPCDLLGGRLTLHFHGIPVLTGRVREGRLGDAEPVTTEAWALKLTGLTGVRVIHVDGDSKTYGIRIEQQTTVAKIDQTSGEATNSSRGVEVFGVYSLLVPEPQSIARLQGIPADDPFTTGL